MTKMSLWKLRKNRIISRDKKSGNPGWVNYWNVGFLTDGHSESEKFCDQLKLKKQCLDEFDEFSVYVYSQKKSELRNMEDQK